MKLYRLFILAIMVSLSAPVTLGCDFFEERQTIECTVVELRQNANTHYYDAIIKVESLTLDQAVKSRFTLVTPTNSYKIDDLTFIEQGNDLLELEPGDIFVVPLSKPDWKFYIREKNEIYCSVDFWELIPEEDRWHPVKSQAMEVARSLETEQTDGVAKPVPQFLPADWELTSQEYSEEAGCGTLVYQKIRDGELKEEVYVEYCRLTDEEKKTLETISETEFLTDWTEWARKFGQPGLIDGKIAVCLDMKGFGRHGWMYRYAYIDDDIAIWVNLDSDPVEWSKNK